MNEEMTVYIDNQRRTETLRVGANVLELIKEKSYKDAGDLIKQKAMKKFGITEDPVGATLNVSNGILNLYTNMEAYNNRHKFLT